MILISINHRRAKTCRDFDQTFHNQVTVKHIDQSTTPQWFAFKKGLVRIKGSTVQTKSPFFNSQCRGINSRTFGLGSDIKPYLSTFQDLKRCFFFISRLKCHFLVRIHVLFCLFVINYFLKFWLWIKERLIRLQCSHQSEFLSNIYQNKIIS